MQASNDPGHDPLEAFPPAPPRAYTIDGDVLMVLSSPMLCLGCLVVVLALVVLGCLVVFLALFPPPGAPPPTISTDSETSKHRLCLNSLHAYALHLQQQSKNNNNS